MQTKLTAGDTLKAEWLVSGYPAGDGWSLKMRFVPREASIAPHTETAATADDGAGYVVQVSAATTATWPPGAYAWAVWVEKAGERYTHAAGQITVLANPAAITYAADVRSHAAKMLDAVEATLEGRATQAQLEIEIAGRRLRYTPMADLLAVRDRYRWEVRAEQAAARGHTGGAGKLLVRL